MKALSKRFKSKIKHKNAEKNSEISDKQNKVSQNFLISEIKQVSEDKESNNESQEEVDQANKQIQDVSK